MKTDKEMLRLEMDDSEIELLSKSKFKKIIKEKISNTTFNYLIELKQKHSKMRKLSYKKFEVSKYLCSPLFNTESRALLLALRTRTVSGVRCDFPGIYQDKQCPLGCGLDDTLENILHCSVLNSQHKSNLLVNKNLNKTNVYSVQLGEELTFMPNLRLQVWEGGN